MAVMKVAQATEQETVYKLRTDESIFVLVLYKTQKFDSSHNYVGYSLYDGTQTIFSGEDFRVPKGQKPIGAWASMQLLGILTDSDSYEGHNHNQLEFIESPACEEISIMVSDYEERQSLALVKA